MICPQCGKPNDSSASYCSSCGAALTSPKGNGASDNQEEFYKAIIGSKNQDYYLRHFSRFDRDGKAGASWHWPALFVAFYWFLYRKMWLTALVYFVLPYIVMIPLGVLASVAGDSAQAIIGLGYILLVVGIWLLPPMYANALYYKHCKKKILETRASSHDLQRQLGELSGRGGTSNVVLIIVLIFVFVAVIGILAAIAIPAYQDYSTRARMAQVVSIGKGATEAVADYYAQHQQAPASLEQAGYVAPPSQAIKDIGVNSQNGVVTMTLAGAPIEGETLLWVPSLDEKGQMSWTCMSEDIKDKYLPSQCRQKK